MQRRHSEKTAGDTTSLKEDDFDTFVPESRVREEFDVTAMTLHRWDRDPELGFPPPITIRGRKYRSRKQLQAFKDRQVKLATRNRKVLAVDSKRAAA